MKKILIVTPRFPFPATGACEQDRASGIEMFVKLGCEIRVITKVIKGSEGDVQEIEKKFGIKIFPITYKFTRDLPVHEKIKRYVIRILNPLFWDGASYEYRDKEITEVFNEQLVNFRPDVVWFEYTYLWPLYKFAQKHNVPIITRSINFEPTHFLEEEGFNFLNLIKFVPKLLSEIITSKKSNVMLAITPKEERIYKKLSPKTHTLPLRALYKFLDQERIIDDKKILNVLFMGSTYNVPHNRRALELIIKEIVPRVEKFSSEKFTFHITGRKLPDDLRKFFNKSIIYHNYIDDLDSFLKDMDIALVPSLFGAGMQQKIFEPLARGIPTITSERGVVGYPFKNTEHIILARNTKDFVEGLLRMQDFGLRKKLSQNARLLCRELFSRERMFSIVKTSLIEAKENHQ